MEPLRPLPKQPVLEFSASHRFKVAPPSLFDLRNSVLTNSGRSALRYALELLHVARGDYVLVPTYHCPTMISPVEALGAIPLFYPITTRGLPDLDVLRSLIRTRQVRAMLVAHLFGLPNSLRDVASICNAASIAIVEDCAHCFFGYAGDAPVGSTGDYAIGSLPKFFPVIEGGILASNIRPTPPARLLARSAREELMALWDIVDLSSRAGRLGILGQFVRVVSYARRGTDADSEHSFTALDVCLPADIRREGLADPLLKVRALRRTELALIRNQNLATIAARRQANYRAIVEATKAIDCVELPFADCPPSSAPYVVPLLLRDKADERYSRMRARKLPVFRWDRSWPDTPQDNNDPASTWSKHLIQVACHQSLTPDEVDRLCRQLRESISC